MLQGNNSIMTEKLTRRGLRIHTDFEPDVLHRVAVRETMSRDVPTIASSMTVNELARRIAQHDPVLTRHQGLPIVNDHGHLVGLITRGDLLQALEGDPEGNQTVFEAGTQNPIVAFADESLYDAATRMLKRNIGRLPVVERVEPTRLVGYLGRSGILSARLRVLEEEHIREQGWWPSKSSDRVIG
jgi:CBS domain-containing protein